MSELFEMTATWICVAFLLDLRSFSVYLVNSWQITNICWIFPLVYCYMLHLVFTILLVAQASTNNNNDVQDKTKLMENGNYMIEWQEMEWWIPFFLLLASENRCTSGQGMNEYLHWFVDYCCLHNYVNFHSKIVCSKEEERWK